MVIPDGAPSRRAMCARPVGGAEGFLEFFGEEFVTEGWLREAAAIPRSRPPARLRLAPGEPARLSEACAPGERLLGYE